MRATTLAVTLPQLDPDGEADTVKDVRMAMRTWRQEHTQPPETVDPEAETIKDLRAEMRRFAASMQSGAAEGDVHLPRRLTSVDLDALEEGELARRRTGYLHALSR